MKNIKTFIIGFLSCACLFLFMGAGSYGSEGKYQLIRCQDQGGYGHLDGWVIFDTERGVITAWFLTDDEHDSIKKINELMK